MTAFISICISILANATSYTLKNGSPLLVETDAALPRQVLRLTFMGGPGLLKKELQGAPTVLSEIFNEGPAGLSRDDFQKKIFLLNGAVTFAPAQRVYEVTMTAPPGDLPAMLELAQSVLNSPKLDDATFQKAKSTVLASLNSRYNRMNLVARTIALRDGLNWHPDAIDGSGSPYSISKLELPSVSEAQKICTQWQNARFTSIGPMSPEKVKALIEKVFYKHLIEKFKEFKFETLGYEAIKVNVHQGAIIVKDGVADHQVYAIFPRPAFPSGRDLVVGEIIQDILGGGMSSRLMRVLRSERGLTYGVGSRVSLALPYWAIGSFASTANLSKLLLGVREVVESLVKEPITREEIHNATASLRQAYLVERELPHERLFLKLTHSIWNLDKNYEPNYLKWLDSISLKEVHKFARSYFPFAGAKFYLMGDSAATKKALENIGISAQEIRTINYLETY